MYCALHKGIVPPVLMRAAAFSSSTRISPGSPPSSSLRLVTGVHERPLLRADCRAPPAEVALGFYILPLCLVHRARLLARFASDAGTGPAQLQDALCSAQREQAPVRADEPAEGAVEEERDEEDDDKHNRPCRKDKVEEVVDAEQRQERGREHERHDKEEDKDNPADGQKEGLVQGPYLGDRCVVCDLLHDAHRAGVPAEEPAEHEHQQEDEREPEGAGNEGGPEPHGIPQHERLELVGRDRREDQKAERSRDCEQQPPDPLLPPARVPEVPEEDDDHERVHKPDRFQFRAKGHIRFLRCRRGAGMRAGSVHFSSAGYGKKDAERAPGHAARGCTGLPENPPEEVFGMANDFLLECRGL